LRYNTPVTAKESLSHLVDDLSEEEALIWLARMGARNGDGMSDYEVAQRQSPLRGETDMDKLLALIDEWMADESGLDEKVLPRVEAALKKSGGVRLREPSDW
jgi:hypothetical protein